MSGDELSAVTAEHVTGEYLGVDSRRLGTEASVEQALAPVRDGFLQCQWVASSAWESRSCCD